MLATPTVADELAEWKTKRNATVLAHHYQEPELQELADLVGDNLDLARASQTLGGDVIAVCGARFIAEMVKVLNPHRTVLLPDVNAGCSLVDSCPVAGIRSFKRRNPKHVIVSYINTSLEVKAESDLLCTADNAVAVVNSVPPDRPILFVPDINLGNYVKRQTGRANMQIWQGACIVHATFAARRLLSVRKEHPEALVAAHPECSANVLQVADFIGSSSAIVDWCRRETAQEFIIVTESGVRRSLEKQSPGKKFYFVNNESCNCSECPYLRMNTPEKLIASLQNVQPRIELSPDIIERARPPIERLLAFA